jgi:hypothetical protein
MLQYVPQREQKCSLMYHVPAWVVGEVAEGNMIKIIEKL